MAYTGASGIASSLFYASLNTGCVLIVLFGHTYVPKVIPTLKPSIALLSIFIALSVILMLIGCIYQNTTPTIWEGIGLYFFMIAPLTSLIDSFKIIPYPFVLGIALGSFYYHFVGSLFSALTHSAR